jgi:hypothetical protein
VEKIVEDIQKMDDEYVKKNEKRLIGNFPNTYTFTKNMAEKQLVKNKGNLKCVIWRPSIISSAMREPMPGWTDSLSAAGGLTLLASLGVVKRAYKPLENPFDMIPVDIVSNGCLVATVNAASSDLSIHIFNCGTSV